MQELAAATHPLSWRREVHQGTQQLAAVSERVVRGAWHVRGQPGMSRCGRGHLGRKRREGGVGSGGHSRERERRGGGAQPKRLNEITAIKHGRSRVNSTTDSSPTVRS